MFAYDQVVFEYCKLAFTNDTHRCALVVANLDWQARLLIYCEPTFVTVMGPAQYRGFLVVVFVVGWGDY